MSFEGSRRHWTPATYGTRTPKTLDTSTRNIPPAPTKFIFRAEVARLCSAKAMIDGPVACRPYRCGCGGIETKFFFLSLKKKRSIIAHPSANAKGGVKRSTPISHVKPAFTLQANLPEVPHQEISTHACVPPIHPQLVGPKKVSVGVGSANEGYIPRIECIGRVQLYSVCYEFHELGSEHEIR